MFIKIHGYSNYGTILNKMEISFLLGMIDSIILQLPFISFYSYHEVANVNEKHHLVLLRISMNRTKFRGATWRMKFSYLGEERLRLPPFGKSKN